MTKYSLTYLFPSDEDYLDVFELFDDHCRMKKRKLEITSVHRVDNVDLKNKFEKTWRTYRQKYNRVRVVSLFHGTKDSNVNQIVRNNFDISRAGDETGCRYGAGVSFSAHANYASHYADQGDTGTLILSEVLVSNIVEVKENQSQDPSTWLREPPYIPGQYPLRYDTTAKNKDTMDVIVKFDKNSFYPSHVVKFKRIPTGQYPRLMNNFLLYPAGTMLVHPFGPRW